MSAEEGPPLGKPGFDLYANQQGRIIGANAALIVLTTIFVSLRLLSRRLSRAGFWWDDLLAVLALVFCILCCIINLLGIKQGYGRHIWIFGIEDARKKARTWIRNLYIFEPLYHTSTSLAKLSILAFYYRIFNVPAFRRIVYLIAALVMGYAVSVVLTCIFQCTPIHSFWDVNVPGHCINVDRFFIASGSVNVVLDFFNFILPLPLLWRLRTSVAQKIVLTTIFTVAGFVVIVSMVRVIVLARINEADITWNYINAGIWSAVEPSVAVMCACLPSLRPLFSVLYETFSAISSTGGKIMGNSNTSNSGASSKWAWSIDSKGRMINSDGSFSRIDEGPDDRLGHNCSVHGGKTGEGGEVEELELPQRGIQVKTEVVLISTERLDYKDRLF